MGSLDEFGLGNGAPTRKPLATNVGIESRLPPGGPHKAGLGAGVPPSAPASPPTLGGTFDLVTLDLGTVVASQVIIPPGKAFIQVAVQAFSTGASAYLAFGGQAKLVPVIFVGQSWDIRAGENGGLFFSNPIAQPGKTLKLFVGYTTTTQGDFPQTYKLTTFRALYRNVTRPYAISVAPLANTLTKLASIYHLASSVFLAKLRHVWITLESVSAAGIFMVQLRSASAASGTGPPSGGTTITPFSTRSSVTGAEATAMLTPTLPNIFGTTLAEHEYNLGITGAVPTVNPPAGLSWIDLLNPTGGEPDSDRELPQLRPGVSEGWDVVLDASAAATVKGYVTIEFTEEPVP